MNTIEKFCQNKGFEFKKIIYYFNGMPIKRKGFDIITDKGIIKIKPTQYNDFKNHIIFDNKKDDIFINNHFGKLTLNLLDSIYQHQ